MGLNRTDPRYTGSLYSDLTAIGFYVVSLSGRQRGDVLLNVRRHVVMYLGSGHVGGARIDERGHARGGRPGDNTGREVCIHPYYNYPWDYCLRPPSNTMAEWIASSMEWYCHNDQYGYDQDNRWGTTACDCSSLIYRIIYDYENHNGSSASSEDTSAAYTPTYVDVDGDGGHNTVFLLEYTMGVRGENRNNAVISNQARADKSAVPNLWAVDYGDGGSDTVRRLQSKLGLNTDGYWGYNTSYALQKYLKSYGHNLDVDGSFGPQSFKVLQWALNHGQINPTWLYGSRGWWYANGRGGYDVGWDYINGKWYYFSGDGWMQTGWIKDRGEWYYCSRDGDMVAGWVTSNGKKYYLAGNGKMVNNATVSIDGAQYTFNSDGSLA